MDLLEDFDRRNLDNVTSSSVDSDSSSDSDSDSSQDSSKNNTIETIQNMPIENIDDNSGNNDDSMHDLDKNGENKTTELKDNKNNTHDTENFTNKEVSKQFEAELDDDKNNTQETEEFTNKEVSKNFEDSNSCANNDEKYKNEIPLEEYEIQVNSGNDTEAASNKNNTTIDKTDALTNVQGFISSNDTENNLIVTNINDIPIHVDILVCQDKKPDKESTKVTDVDEISEITKNPTIDDEKETVKILQKSAESNTENTQNESTQRPDEIDNDTKSNDTTEGSNNKNLSEGEVSSNESSDVEACELRPEIVCISDEELDSNKAPKKKKHKKKEKKSKKEKKGKKSKSDFRESADQNFYRDVHIHVVDKEDEKVTSDSKECVSLVDDDDVYEILELSDDSSCYEVEGTVLSKEPTAEEIEALSAKIDEIEREDVITEEQIREHERKLLEKRNTNKNNTENNDNSQDINLENISWKDRYLGSKKVKTVLTTSNILNALRKKNKELKKKLEESKKKEEQIEEPAEIPVENKELEEGSIEHYHTLQGSTKYVNPVPDPVTENKEIDGTTETPDKTQDKNNIEIQVTGEMKKDAKQLLKMYKKLLKYNDMAKPKDPNKKKKKKQKKKEKYVNVVCQ